MKWLPGADVHDLSSKGIGNGPFRDFRGVALHVNVSRAGTPSSFWGNGNAGQVCPNFQVFKDGSVDQMLPLDWQPWCQMDGNFQYAAIETAGMPDEPLTDAQLDTCARILAAYRDELGMTLAVVDKPGQRGLITHQAGGAAWGGHSCPGTIRAGQRAEIIRRASRAGDPTEQEFTVNKQDADTIRSIVRDELAREREPAALRVWSIPLGSAKVSAWHCLATLYTLATRKPKP